jgi:hypothetical protein
MQDFDPVRDRYDIHCPQTGAWARTAAGAAARMKAKNCMVANWGKMGLKLADLLLDEEGKTKR